MASLLFRADASVAIGTGHVMRCLALAQAWQDAGGTAIFACAETTPALSARLQNEGCEVVALDVQPGSPSDSYATADLAQKLGAMWVVADSYSFGADYQVALKDHGLKLLFLDDYGHAGHYSADLVLNPNLQGDALYQNRRPSTRLLLGPRYVLLRREFAGWRDWKRNIPPVAQCVLVTMGGSDPANITQIVVQAILSLPILKATVVVGGSNPHLPALRSLVASAKGNVSLQQDVTNMAELMAAADIAVAAAGTTSWELACMGLPALLVVLAENQRFPAEELERRGAAMNLGAQVQPSLLSSRLAHLVNSQDARRAMSERGRELVDGRGGERVTRAIRNAALIIRRATQADCKPLWELANDPVVRASAFSPAPIPWEDHMAWFNSKMQAPKAHILIGEVDGQFAGQVRIDEEPGGDGRIDVSVARAFRGTGLGSELIDLAVREVLASSEVQTVHAYVLPLNHASRRAFENAGFRGVGEEVTNGHRALHFIRRRTTP